MVERHTLANRRKMNTLCRGWYPNKSKKACQNKSAGIHPHPYLCEMHYKERALSRKIHTRHALYVERKLLLPVTLKASHVLLNVGRKITCKMVKSEMQL